VNPSRTHQWLGVAILFAAVYLLVGVAFPNPPASNRMQFVWRLGAWVICASAFATHIGLEHFRFRRSPRSIALHASVAVALGAFALAAAANIHARRTGTGNRGLLALALVIWPIMTGVPAWLTAWAAAAALARVRPNQAANTH
jgi:hypothetical protein